MEPQEERLSTVYTVSLVLFLVGVLLFLSLLHGQRDMVLLTILILAVAAGTKAWSLMSLSGLTYGSVIDKERLFPGETFSLRIHLENAKWLPVWVRAEIESGSRDGGLLWRQRIEFDWEFTAQKRGVYPVGPPRLMVGDLLGFYLKEKATEARYIIVYPRIVPLRPLPFPETDFFGSPGTKSPVKDPVYILGTRDYQYSRPARHIHWKASARHNRLQEKLFEPSEQAKVLIALDLEQFAETGSGDDFERTLEVIASLALRFDRQGYSFGFVTNGKVTGGGPTLLPVARNPRHLLSLLEILARLRMVPGDVLKDKIIRDLSLPWRTSAVLFAFRAGSSVLSVKETLKRMKIPSLLVVSHRNSDMDEYPGRFAGRIYRCDEVRLGGEGQK